VDDYTRGTGLLLARRDDLPSWLDRGGAIAARLLLMGLTLAGAVWALNRLQFLVVALVLGFAPVGRRPAAEAAGSEGLRVTGAWFYASTLTGLIDALGIGLGLWLLDVPLVVPIMTLTFILGYIPMVGATIAGAVAVVVALASGGLATALGALVVVIAVQQLEGNVLSPQSCCPAPSASRRS
jgi:putative heme transporter